MSAFRKLEPSDLTRYTLHASPRVLLASGSGGWRGNTGTSGSVSLYGGIRERSPSAAMSVRPTVRLQGWTIDGDIDLTGSYPSTGSIDWVKVRNVVHPPTRENWGEEHFRPIMNLYEHYVGIDPDYVTGSYDFYSLYSEASSSNSVEWTAVGHSASWNTMSSSYTIEARIKPLSITGADRLIARRGNVWKLFVSGSSRLALSASDGSGLIYTSSFAVTRNRWQHVAWRVGGGSGSFTVDLVDAGQIVVTGNLDTSTNSGDLVAVLGTGSDWATSFHGLIGDVRVWNVERTFSQLSQSFDRTLASSGSSNLLLYARWNDGPRATVVQGTTMTMGSGTFNYGSIQQAGELKGFTSRHAPVWHPSDDRAFTTYKRFVVGSEPTMLRVLHVPSLYYGRQIATGSVRITCNAFLGSGIVRTVVDDGRGGLYISGSVGSSSLSEREEYSGVGWNKVGNVFYSEGIVVIKDPALLDMGEGVGSTPMDADRLQVSFRGQTTIPTQVLNCRARAAEFNCSNNSTFSNRNPDTGNLDVALGSSTTYITAVGLYDSRRRLVAVAKIAQPIRNREKEKINIRLRMDF